MSTSVSTALTSSEPTQPSRFEKRMNIGTVYPDAGMVVGDVGVRA